MQRIWATAATVWAVLGVTAALAWTQASTRRPAASTATSAAATAPPKGTTADTAATPPPPTRPPARHERAPNRASGSAPWAATASSASPRARATRAGRARALAAARAEVAACERALSRFLRRQRPLAGQPRRGRLGRGRRPHGRRDPGGARRPARPPAGRYDPTVLAGPRRGRLRPLVRAASRTARRAPAAGWRPGARGGGRRRPRARGRRRGDRPRRHRQGLVRRSGALDAMRDAWPAMPGGLVDLGGDLALWGRTPENGPWRIAVADPRVPGEPPRDPPAGGRRAWRPRGATGAASAPAGPLHHLIDPATGRPAAEGPARGHRRGPRARPRRGLRDADRGGRRGATAEEAVAAHADLAALVVPGHRPPVAPRARPRRVRPGVMEVAS